MPSFFSEKYKEKTISEEKTCFPLDFPLQILDSESLCLLLDFLRLDLRAERSQNLVIIVQIFEKFTISKENAVKLTQISERLQIELPIGQEIVEVPLERVLDIFRRFPQPGDFLEELLQHGFARFVKETVFGADGLRVFAEQGQLELVLHLQLLENVEDELIQRGGARQNLGSALPHDEIVEVEAERQLQLRVHGDFLREGLEKPLFLPQSRRSLRVLPRRAQEVFPSFELGAGKTRGIREILREIQETAGFCSCSTGEARGAARGMGICAAV